jgi:hypothetical protein
MAAEGGGGGGRFTTAALLMIASDAGLIAIAGGSRLRRGRGARSRRRTLRHTLAISFRSHGPPDRTRALLAGGVADHQRNAPFVLCRAQRGCDQNEPRQGTCRVGRCIDISHYSCTPPDPSRKAANLMQRADRNIAKTIQLGNIRLSTKGRCALIALSSTGPHQAGAGCVDGRHSGPGSISPYRGDSRFRPRRLLDRVNGLRRPLRGGRPGLGGANRGTGGGRIITENAWADWSHS